MAAFQKRVKENSFKRQPHKMVKRTQTFRRLLPTNCLSVFDHFVGLALKGLTKHNSRQQKGYDHQIQKRLRDSCSVQANLKDSDDIIMTTLL